MAPSDSAGKKPSKGQPDEMVEIRFFVPGQSTRVKGSDMGSNVSDAEDDGEDISAAQAFHDAIKEKAELGHVSGDIILSFEEVLVLTPRGRYDVDMFPDFLRLRGKTYDYKIVYTSISRLFLLPKDDLHILFIVRLINSYTSLLADSCPQAWPQYTHPTRSNPLSVPGHAI
jgi:structure-specific recognition protein 1